MSFAVPPQTSATSNRTACRPGHGRDRSAVCLSPARNRSAVCLSPARRKFKSVSLNARLHHKRRTERSVHARIRTCAACKCGNGARRSETEMSADFLSFPPNASCVFSFLSSPLSLSLYLSLFPGLRGNFGCWHSRAFLDNAALGSALFRCAFQTSEEETKPRRFSATDSLPLPLCAFLQRWTTMTSTHCITSA